MNKKSPLSVFLNGIIEENPVFVMLLRKTGGAWGWKDGNSLSRG